MLYVLQGMRYCAVGLDVCRFSGELIKLLVRLQNVLFSWEVYEEMSQQSTDHYTRKLQIDRPLLTYLLFN